MLWTGCCVGGSTVCLESRWWYIQDSHSRYTVIEGVQVKLIYLENFGKITIIYVKKMQIDIFKI